MEADETYVLESRKGARGLGRKAPAGRQGEEARPLARAAGDRSGHQRGAAQGMRRRSRLPSILVAKDALLVSDGASYPVSHAQPLDGGTGGAICMCRR